MAAYVRGGVPRCVEGLKTSGGPEVSAVSQRAVGSNRKPAGYTALTCL